MQTHHCIKTTGKKILNNYSVNMHASLSKTPSSICVRLLSDGKQEGASANPTFQGFHRSLKVYIICRKLHRFNSSHKRKMFLYCERNPPKTDATAFPRCFLVLWFTLASKIKPKEE